MRKLILVLPCVVLAGWHAPRLSAEVTPHGLFTDNMVLQQGDKVPVWGTADPGEKVTVTIQEHIHIPSKQPGHEGWLMFVADLHEQGLSEAILVEAEHLDRGPIARIKLPLRLRVQVHGSWAPREQLPPEH